ncbi:hypothetical protein D3C76_1588650 [compost metagenome]
MANRRNVSVLSISRSARSTASLPWVVCVFITSNSSSVSLPGFRRIWSGIPTLPMSCSGAEVTIRLICSGLRMSAYFSVRLSWVASSLIYSFVL